MNAKKELMDMSNGQTIKCAHIQYRQYWGNTPKNLHTLKIGHTKKELILFLNSLDFEYDNDYYGQLLYGYVWFDDGTWLERGKYNGSEWWEHKACPKIPNELSKQ